MSTLKQFRDTVKSLVKEKASILADPGDYDLCIRRALVAYSTIQIPTNLARPMLARKVVEDVAVDANGEIDTADMTSFDIGYIDQLKIETTIATSGDPEFIGDGDWRVVDKPDAQVIRLSKKPDAAETARVTHFVNHALPLTDAGNPDDDGAMTIPLSDEDAVASEAAAYGCRMLSNYYTQTADTASGADFVGFTTKGREYSSRADMLHSVFTDHIDEIKKRTRSRATTVRG